MDRKNNHKSGRYYSIEERHKIIQEYISRQCTKAEIWEKYTGQKQEHGNLLKWMRHWVTIQEIEPKGLILYQIYMICHIKRKKWIVLI